MDKGPLGVDRWRSGGCRRYRRYSCVAQKEEIITEVEVGDFKSEVASIAGHIEFVSLYDSTDRKYYYLSDLPVAIPLGHAVSATAEYYNDDPNAAHTFYCRIEWLDPDGFNYGVTGCRTTLGVGESEELSIDPPFKLNKPGTWKVHAELSD